MRISRTLIIVLCSITLALALSNCGFKPKHSLLVSISSDGESFVWTLDGKEILSVSTANLQSATETYNVDGSLRSRTYKFLSKKGEQIEIDVDKFGEGMKRHHHLHATGKHVLEIDGAKYTAKAEYTFDDNWFNNIKVTLLLPPGTESSNALFAEGNRPKKE